MHIQFYKSKHDVSREKRDSRGRWVKTTADDVLSGYVNGKDKLPWDSELDLCKIVKKTYGLKDFDWLHMNVNAFRNLFQGFDDLSEVVGISKDKIGQGRKLRLLANDPLLPDHVGGTYNQENKCISLSSGTLAKSLAHEWAHFIDNVTMFPSKMDRLAERNYASTFTIIRDESPELYDLMEYIRDRKSDMNIASIDLDADIGEHYWSKPEEMFARCFEVYCADNLQSMGKSDSPLIFSENSTAGVYPQGEQRKRINILMSKYLESLKQSGKLQKAMMMFYRKPC